MAKPRRLSLSGCATSESSKSPTVLTLTGSVELRPHRSSCQLVRQNCCPPVLCGRQTRRFLPMARRRYRVQFNVEGLCDAIRYRYPNHLWYKAESVPSPKQSNRPGDHELAPTPEDRTPPRSSSPLQPEPSHHLCIM
jgi:hypothetical protein